MKIEKLFKLAQKVFILDVKEDKKSEEKKDELLKSLDKKIASMKDKIKDTDSKKKHEELKKEIDILIKLRDKI
jgi:hypothetical protein